MSSAETPDYVGDVLGRIDVVRGEGKPVAERLEVAAFIDEVVVDQVLRDHNVRECVHQRHVGARLEWQMVVGLDVRSPHEGDLARIADDQSRALPKPLASCVKRKRDGLPSGWPRSP